MTIKSGIGANSIVVGSGDTTLLNPSSDERFVVSSGTFHEQTGAAETVELFISPDATSAAGERFQEMKFSPDETKNPVSIYNRAVTAGSFLIAKAATGGRVEANLTFTLYDGDEL